LSSSAFTISKKEAAILKKITNSANPVILPNIHIPKIQKNIPTFEARKDIIFLGGFQHTPNIDAALFLSNEIFPLLKKKITDLKLSIVGSKPPNCIQALACKDIIVTGYVTDITPYMQASRAMVAPIRYGAGVKGKITESMSNGLPVVTTRLGAEGLETIDGKSILIANSPREFASKLVRLYTNRNLWNTISANSYKLALTRYSPENIMEMFRILL
jgi:O-antigen biosynthesis protein